MAERKRKVGGKTTTKTITGSGNGFQLTPTEYHLFLYNDDITGMLEVVFALLVIWDVLSPEEANIDPNNADAAKLQFLLSKNQDMTWLASQVMQLANDVGYAMVPVKLNEEMVTSFSEYDFGMSCIQKVRYLQTLRWSVGENPEGI